MTKPHATREILTTEEAAELLRLHPKTVARWARQGKIPGAVRDFGDWRFSRAALMRAFGGGDSGGSSADATGDPETRTPASTMGRRASLSV